MSNPPHAHLIPRPARVRPAEFTPAVLRVPDGTCTPGEVELFSLTGGLLSLPKPLDRGSRVKVVFLTATGPVLGEVEMLRPVSWTEQPFRFVSLQENDQRRLRAATQPEGKADAAVRDLPAAQDRTAAHTAAAQLDHPVMPSLNQATPDHEQLWIEKYRAAISNSESAGSRLPKILLAALTLASVGLGVFYVCQTYLLRLAPSIFAH
jgi:hypothetical protein